MLLEGTTYGHRKTLPTVTWQTSTNCNRLAKSQQRHALRIISEGLAITATHYFDDSFESWHSPPEKRYCANRVRSGNSSTTSAFEMSRQTLTLVTVRALLRIKPIKRHPKNVVALDAYAMQHFGCCTMGNLLCP